MTTEVAAIQPQVKPPKSFDNFTKHEEWPRWLKKMWPLYFVSGLKAEDIMASFTFLMDKPTVKSRPWRTLSRKRKIHPKLWCRIEQLRWRTSTAPPRMLFGRKIWKNVSVATMALGELRTGQESVREHEQKRKMSQKNRYNLSHRCIEPTRYHAAKRPRTSCWPESTSSPQKWSSEERFEQLFPWPWWLGYLGRWEQVWRASESTDEQKSWDGPHKPYIASLPLYWTNYHAAIKSFREVQVMDASPPRETISGVKISRFWTTDLTYKDGCKHGYELWKRK